MLEIPENILDFFFIEINKKGKYEVILKENGALIKPRLEEEYYKPIIVIKDLEELKNSLINYVEALNEFYVENNILEEHHDLSYFFNNLFLNMTVSDALDLAQYIDKRSYFLGNNQFVEFKDPTLLMTSEDTKFYVQRVLESPGLETPYVLVFSMEKDGIIYQLPLVRCAFDENNICHLFAIQFGRFRQEDVKNAEYKRLVNRINSGVDKYRNVSPGFVISFYLFLQILNDNGINRIVAPDYLFGRYRRYYKGQSETKSDLILNRILNNFLVLFQRMEYQFPFLEIENYPNEIDSYTHIKLKEISINNKVLNKNIKKEFK